MTGFKTNKLKAKMAEENKESGTDLVFKQLGGYWEAYQRDDEKQVHCLYEVFDNTIDVINRHDSYNDLEVSFKHIKQLNSFIELMEGDPKS